MSLGITFVKYYPYRTARIHRSNLISKLPNALTRELRAELHAQLSKSLGIEYSRQDNHEVFEFLDASCETVYAFFTDGVTYIGTSIYEGKY